MSGKKNINLEEAEEALSRLKQKRFYLCTSDFVHKYIGELQELHGSRREVYNALIAEGINLASYQAFSESWSKAVKKAQQMGKEDAPETPSLSQEADTPTDPSPPAIAAATPNPPPILSTDTDTSAESAENENMEQKNRRMWENQKVPPEIQALALKQLPQDKKWRYLGKDAYKNPTFFNPETGAKKFLI